MYKRSLQKIGLKNEIGEESAVAVVSVLASRAEGSGIVPRKFRCFANKLK